MDFIGIGAQKAGTSWAYACLYEHPEICAPIKEIHFFSRDRFKKGQTWYESNVARCEAGKLKGEFSTSYLYHPQTAARIAELYPSVKLIAILRNPIDRAYSQYRNAIKAGEVSRKLTFEEYIKKHPDALEQGLYAKQLYRYYEYFSRVQLHVLIYEDSKKDPLTFINSMYEFLEVDAKFVPKMLKKHVNVSRTPRFVFIDKITHKIAEGLRKIGLDKLVFAVKKSGVTDAVRSVNTSESTAASFDRAPLQKYFAEDVRYLSQLLHRDMNAEWDI